MAGQNLLQFIGGQPQKQTRYVSLFTSRFLIGLYTNKSPLRGPLGSLYSDFYHMGATDALIDGLNSELSVRSTLIRRPGNPKYSTAVTTGAIDSFYSFHESDGDISVIADSATDFAVMTPSSNTSLFTKSAGAGQGYFQGVDISLYFGDGVDLIKYIPDGPNVNPLTGKSIWNLGGAAPTAAPTLTVVETGATAVSWAATTWFSTMGIVVDTNGQAQQLISVNADGTNPGSQIGLSGNGGPSFNQTPGGTTSDNTVTWTNLGPIGVWKPLTGFNGIGGSGGTLLSPAMIYDAASGGFYANSRTGTGISTGATKPAFNGVVGLNYFDGSCNWVCYANAFNPSALADLRYGSPNFQWVKNHVYGGGSGGLGTPNSALIEPNAPPPLGTSYPATPIIYYQYSSGGTSQVAAYAPWGGTAKPAGVSSLDGQLSWMSLGSATWGAGVLYSAWTQPNSANFSCVKDTAGCLQVCITGGLSGGSAPWHIWVAGATHSVTGTTSIITDTNGNLQVVSAITTGISAGSPPTWGTTLGSTVVDGGVTWKNNGSAYGSTTADGAAVWVNVGLYAGAVWAAGQNFYLPKSGFYAPRASIPYGGADVVDTNSNIEFVINTGLSGGSTPSWGAIGARTTDNTVTWFNNGARLANSFSWTSGYGYCFAFKARRNTDAFVLNTPPMWTAPLGPPTGCGDGTVTTASPVVQVIGGNAGGVVQLTGLGSIDPQFDTIEVYRSTDGFGPGGPYLFLTDIPMPSPISTTQPGMWNLTDFMPDLATNTLPGLSPLTLAPIAFVNDPPPGQFGSTQFISSGPNTPTVAAAGTALQGIVYHEARNWGFIGNLVFASGGPATNPGNGFTSWPPTYVFPFASDVVRLLPTVAGLIVFTTTDIGIIRNNGTTAAITNYEALILVPGIGVLSWNAVTTIAGVPYIFSSDRQLLGIDPNGGITRVGHNIGDKLALFDPTLAYLTYHSFGDRDNALFIGDGVGQWYRCDINMAPDGKETGPVWSPRATIAGGFKALQSIETSAGVRQLLIGPTSSNYVLARDSTFANFLDNGSAYGSNFVIGCVVLAHPGQLAEIDFIENDFTKVGTLPTVSIMFDEISATGGAAFEIISNQFVSDPPKMYGPNGTPNTLWMNRYYIGQTTSANPGTVPLPAWCKFMQLKVDFGNTDTVENELLAFTIFGALWADK